MPHGRSIPSAATSRLTPPCGSPGYPPLYEDTTPYLGRSSHYPKGVRENGMYSHGVQWLVRACRLLSEQFTVVGDAGAAALYRDAAARIWYLGGLIYFVYSPFDFYCIFLGLLVSSLPHFLVYSGRESENGMEDMLKWLNISVAGNELWRIYGFFAVLLITALVGRLGRIYLNRLAAELGRKKRDIASAVALSSGQAVLLAACSLGFILGLDYFSYPVALLGLVDTVKAVLMVAVVGHVAYCLVDVVDAILMNLASRTESKLDDMLAPMVRKSLRVTIVVLVLVQMATILSDKPITSILAGLGVGGLAVALAAQDTVKNFFGSLVILADKPFELGDRVLIDGFDGSVEEVGFRSTRIRTLDGHLVSVPNGELANKIIRNISKRPNIKHVMKVSVTYDTPVEKMQEALTILKELLADHEGMDAAFPPRVFFNEFADCSLNIMVIFWYHPAEYWDYCAFTERFNTQLLHRFNEAGIEFAFPTQTVYLAGQNVPSGGVPASG